MNFVFWKMFGLWPGRGESNYYKYYSCFYIFTTLIAYNILLTLNLIYTPRNLDNLLREVIFYFTEIIVTSKVLTILFMRKTIIKSFDIQTLIYLKEAIRRVLK